MENPTERAEKLEERADYIESQNLLIWNIEDDFFTRIQDKLIGPGAKLLVGPRGCGKTHQMRVAFLNCAKDTSLPAPIYVSFTRYYHLEPFLHHSTAAIKVFQTWVLAKILEAVHIAADALALRSKPELPADLSKIRRFVELAEKGTIAEDDELIEGLTVPLAISVIESFATLAGRRRAILLLDDAALTLTPEYLVEFFETFRSLKTRIIAPKASVYPGTTEYGPRFHVGQDAEAVNAWLSVQEPGYGAFLGSLVTTRFDGHKALTPGMLELLKYAAFGMPRALIVLLRKYLDTQASTSQERLNKAIEMQAGYIETEYRSLAKKLPQYKTIVEAGWDLFRASTQELAKENSSREDSAPPTRQITLGIAEEPNHKTRKMVRFLLETGLFYELPSVRHGEDRTYERYIPHLLFLIKERAFDSGRGFSPERVSQAIQRRDAKHPLRRSFGSILGQERVDALKLDSQPCQRCGAGRLSDEQRFCHNCGAELSNPSAFESCMELGIDQLPIPDYQIASLQEQGITKIGDFYTRSDPGTRLREAWRIGPVRSGQIYLAAKNAVEEFLER